MSQFYVTNLSIISESNVLHNEYFLLMNIDNLMNEQGKEWYEATPFMNGGLFHAHLARLVHRGRLGQRGAVEMLLRLQERGFIIAEPLRVQVTQKWRDLVEANGGYIQYKISDEAQIKKVDDLFADIMTPKTKSLKEYKETVRQFTYEAKKAFKRKLLTPTWKDRLDKFEGLLKSDFLLKQFFEARLKANGEADNPPNAPPKPKNTEGVDYSKENVLRKVKDLLMFRINLSVRKNDFIQHLRDSKFWLELKAKQGTKLTNQENRWLQKAIAYLAYPDEIDLFYQQKMKEIKAQAAEHQGPVAPDVAAEMAKAKLTTIKEA